MKTYLALAAIFFNQVTLPGEFYNLGFDAPALIRTATGMPVSEILPGWHLSYAGGETIYLNVNIENLSNAPDAFVNAWGAGVVPPDLIEWGYSFVMKNSLLPGTAVWKLSQNGTVPRDTKSLYFKTFYSRATVKMEGRELTPVLLSGGGPFELSSYGVDVSSYAGKEVTLEFSTRPAQYTPYARYEEVHFGLDSIAFSPVPVPEPKPVVLGFALGLTILFGRRWFS